MVDKIQQLNLELLEAYNRIRKVAEQLPDLSLFKNEPLYQAGKMHGELKALESVLRRVDVLIRFNEKTGS